MGHVLIHLHTYTLTLVYDSFGFIIDLVTVTVYERYKGIFLFQFSLLAVV